MPMYMPALPFGANVAMKSKNRGENVISASAKIAPESSAPAIVGMAPMTSIDVAPIITPSAIVHTGSMRFVTLVMRPWKSAISPGLTSVMSSSGAFSSM